MSTLLVVSYEEFLTFFLDTPVAYVMRTKYEFLCPDCGRVLFVIQEDFIINI